MENKGKVVCSNLAYERKLKEPESPDSWVVYDTQEITMSPVPEPEEEPECGVCEVDDEEEVVVIPKKVMVPVIDKVEDLVAEAEELLRELRRIDEKFAAMKRPRPEIIVNGPNDLIFRNDPVLRGLYTGRFKYRKIN